MSKRIYLIIKRVIDFIGGIIGIILVSTVLLITAILIKIESKGKVIFSQSRVGLNGKEFNGEENSSTWFDF
ncbi:sugar transferase [Clostridium tertium]